MRGSSLDNLVSTNSTASPSPSVTQGECMTRLRASFAACACLSHAWRSSGLRPAQSLLVASRWSTASVPCRPSALVSNRALDSGMVSARASICVVHSSSCWLLPVASPSNRRCVSLSMVTLTRAGGSSPCDATEPRRADAARYWHSSTGPGWSTLGVSVLCPVPAVFGRRRALPCGSAMGCGGDPRYGARRTTRGEDAQPLPLPANGSAPGVARAHARRLVPERQLGISRCACSTRSLVVRNMRGDEGISAKSCGNLA